MADILSIHGGPKASSAIEPNNRTIAALESLLERARTGEVQEVAYACITVEGGAITHFTPNLLTDVISLLGTVSLLQTDMGRYLLSNQEAK